MIQNNQTAPAFATPDQNNNMVKLEDFAGSKNVVLYFYPKDDTPGCTIEANQFTEHADAFAQADTVILGVSRDSCSSHVDFISKFDIGFSLLADENGELCNAYGVWQEKERNGEKKMGIVRSTFVIDKQGIVKHAEYGVVPDGHAAAMLDLVKQL